MEIGQSAGKDFAYILGVYLGDGCVTRPSNRSADEKLCFKLNTIDRDFADATKVALKQVTGLDATICEHEVKKSSKANHALYCGCQALCDKLVEMTNAKQQIPRVVWDWPKSDKIAFIEGLMDSEGFVAANRSNPTNRRFYMGYKSCDRWAGEFRDLMESVGIRTGKFSEEPPRKAGYKVPRRFHVKMQSWIDSGARFQIARKQNRVDEWASAGAYENRKPRRSTSEANTPDTQ